MSDSLVNKIASLLSPQNKTLATAESCTGGGLSYQLTAVPGSSAWFEQGFVTYSNNAKTQMLGVDPSLFSTVGAVSEEVVSAMLTGLLARSGCNYGIAVSGIAGPNGGLEGKPVGTVCIGWGDSDRQAAQTYLFAGDREQVRKQAITQSLLNVHQFIRQRE